MADLNDDDNVDVDHKYNTRSKNKKASSLLKKDKNKKNGIKLEPATNGGSEKRKKDLEEEDDRPLDMKKYRTFLNELFPSKYMQEKAANTPTVTGSNALPLNSSPVMQRFNFVVTLPSPQTQQSRRRRNDEIEKEINEIEKYLEKEIVDDEATALDEDYDNEYGYHYENDDDDDDDDDDEYDSDDEETSIEEEEEFSSDDDDKSLQEVAAYKVRRRKYLNTLKFRRLLQDKHAGSNDLTYFSDQMTVPQQEKMLEHVAEVKQFTNDDKPYRLALLESATTPLNYKAVALRKLNTLQCMSPSSGEYFKIKHWVEGFMQIPFGIYNQLPISLTVDGLDKCHAFMANAKSTLDTAVYGLNDAKLQIMQMLGQWLVNPAAIGSAIAIKGPMGTGKTTLVKEGISKILGREFTFIALGGATDSAFLEGHSYTYEGSGWGHIVDILMKSKSMNPVIYFDELDKVSETAKGEEIIGILTHLTDTTQNSKFHDRYYAELEFDLSRCLFIFSYNDESKINPILRDRMYRILTKGYNQAEKITIAQNFLLPKIQEQVRFTKDDVVFEKETLEYIIINHTEKEDGVRNLKRCLEIIHTKLNLFRLMTPGDNLFQNDMKLTHTQVVFPIVVSTFMVDVLIKKEQELGGWRNMYL